MLPMTLFFPHPQVNGCLCFELRLSLGHTHLEDSWLDMLVPEHVQLDGTIAAQEISDSPDKSPLLGVNVSFDESRLEP